MWMSSISFFGSTLIHLITFRLCHWYNTSPSNTPLLWRIVFLRKPRQAFIGRNSKKLPLSVPDDYRIDFSMNFSAYVQNWLKKALQLYLLSSNETRAHLFLITGHNSQWTVHTTCMSIKNFETNCSFE